MKPRFVRLYLIFTGTILTLTALAKLPSTLPISNMCMEGDPILGSHQPLGMSNEHLLAIAAGTELTVVALIFFSPWRWLPCLASALWATLCLIAPSYFMDPATDCGCLGWLAKPGPTTNVIAGLLALALAAGGWLALWITSHDSKRFKRIDSAGNVRKI